MCQLLALMNDLKLYGIFKSAVRFLTDMVSNFSADGMDFGLKMSFVLDLKRNDVKCIDVLKIQSGKATKQRHEGVVNDWGY